MVAGTKQMRPDLRLDRRAVAAQALGKVGVRRGLSAVSLLRRSGLTAQTVITHWVSELAHSADELPQSDRFQVAVLVRRSDALNRDLDHRPQRRGGNGNRS